MATSSNILAWRIPWTEEPGRLQSIGWVGHNWATISCTQPHMRKRSEHLFVRGKKKSFKELSYSNRHSHQLSPIIKLLRKACVCVSCSVVSNSLGPHGLCSLPGSSVHGIFPGKSTGVGCQCLLQDVKHSKIIWSIPVSLFYFPQPMCSRFFLPKFQHSSFKIWTIQNKGEL